MKYKNLYLIVLISIFVLSLFIRLYTLSQPYLINFDPFFWHREAKFLITGNNIYQDEFKDIRSQDQPFSKSSDFFPRIIASLYEFLTIFNKNLNFDQFCFWFPAVIGALCVFPIFFIGKMLFNTTAGLFSAFFYSMSDYFVFQTMAGSLDTEGISILFTCLIICLILFGFYLIKEKQRKNVIWPFAVAGFLLVFFAWTWDGYWLAAWLIIALLPFHYFLIVCSIDRASLKSRLLTGFSYFKDYLYGYLVFFSVFFLAGIIILGKNIISHTLLSPFTFFSKKTGLREFGTDVFPSVQYSVSELQSPKNWPVVINDLGAPLFFLGLAGVLVLLYFLIWGRKQNFLKNTAPIVLILFFATLLPFLGAIKFAIFFAIPLALAAGFFISLLWEKAFLFLKEKKRISKIIIVSLVCLTAYSICLPIYKANSFAKSIRTIVNKDYDEAFGFIKNNTPKNSAMAAWWEWGYLISDITGRRPLVDAGIFNKTKTTPIGEITIKQCEERGGIVNGNNCITSRVQDLAKVFFSQNDDDAVNILKSYKDSSPEMYLFFSPNLIGESDIWSRLATWDRDKKSGNSYKYEIVQDVKGGKIVSSKIETPKELENSLFTRLVLKNSDSSHFKLEFKNHSIKIYKVIF